MEKRVRDVAVVLVMPRLWITEWGPLITKYMPATNTSSVSVLLPGFIPRVSTDCGTKIMNYV